MLNSTKSQQNHQNTRNLLQILFSVDPTKPADPLAHIDSIAQSLLANGKFRNIVVFEGQNKVRNFGSATRLSSEKLLKSNENYHCKKNYCHYRFDINLRNRELAIVASSYDTAPIVNLYQAIICLLLVGTASSIFIIFGVYKLKGYLINSVEKIRYKLINIARGKFDQPDPPNPGCLYNMLMDDIGSLTKEFAEVKQNGSDSTFEELKETLETVEIQNIELDMARKNALSTSRVKSEFFANICHVIRTPLNGIIGFSELLHKTHLSSHQQEYIETIDESAKGLLTVVNDILDFSRLEIGKLSLEYKPTRIRQVIEDSIKIHAPAAEQKRLRLLTIIDHDFPENLLGDPLRLKQVLNNLISNAIKFTHTGHILISVSKESQTHSQLVLKFSVTDSGVGLSEEQQECLFEAFSEAICNEKRSTEGAGLGLAIAKGIVDRMQGRIGVESELDKGATFWFTATLGQNPKAKTNQGYLAGTFSRLNALVCESDPLSRNEITHYLRGWGAKVVEQGDSTKVLSTLRDTGQHTAIQLAILGIDTEHKLFNADRLAILISQLNREYSTAVLLIVNAGGRAIVERLVAASNNKFTLRPLYCNQLHQSISHQLGLGNTQLSETSQTHLTPSLAASHDTAGSFANIKVLAVDDNQANLRLVLELLKALGVATVGVRSGPEVLAELEKSGFDLILMDVQMPAMNGLELTRRIRAQEVPPQRTPIIALTAHTVSEQKSKLLVAGMDDYLTKPVNESELQHVIERWALQNESQGAARRAEVNPQPKAQSASGGEPEPVLVDLQLSLALAKNKADLAKEMLEMMFKDLQQARDQLVPLAEERAFTELQEIVHKIHGGSCYCGIVELKHLSQSSDRKLDDIVNKQAEAEGIERDMQNLTDLIDRLLEWRKQNELCVFFGISDFKTDTDYPI
ncbi:MAG: response regulator [Cellvibrionaceae bacterium]|nr:response regulator [Cellvibrionaceae bacterium]